MMDIKPELKILSPRFAIIEKDQCLVHLPILGNLPKFVVCSVTESGKERSELKFCLVEDGKLKCDDAENFTISK